MTSHANCNCNCKCGVSKCLYFLDLDSVWWINCPIKMATDHFPTASHNFAWCGVISHYQMTTVTLQIKYDPTLPYRCPKVACLLEISSGSGIYSDVGQPLAGRLASTAKRPAHGSDGVYRVVITGSRELRDHHYDAALIYRILKSLLPQNNTLFIATTTVVKDAANDPDC